MIKIGKFSIKKEHFILGTVFVVLLLLLIFPKTGKRNYDLPDLSKISEKDVTKIIITKETNIITLNKEDDKWLINDKKYLADNNSINEMLKTITNFQLTELISESKNFTLYELDDSKKINIAVYKNNKVILNFDIGKTSPTHQHTFVKLNKTPQIYNAEGNFKQQFTKQVSDLRDKIVMQIAKQGINEITLTDRHKRTMMLMLKKESEIPLVTGTNKQQAAPPKETWKTDKGKEAKENEINDILDTLANLTCSKFINDKTIADYKNPIYTIILKGAEEHSISIYKKIDDDNFPAVSSKRKYPFVIPKNQADKLMKKFNVF